MSAGNRRTVQTTDAPSVPAAIRPQSAAPKAGRRGRKPGGTQQDTGELPEVAVSLIRAALDLFASRNFSSVTIKDIASAVGVNPSLIYYYFGNKDDLFLGVVNYVVEEAFKKYEQSMKNDIGPVEVISQWIETHIVQFVLMQKLAKISLDYASTPAHSESADKAIRKFYDREAIVLRRAIGAGIAKGLFRPVEPQDMAIFISTFLDGTLFRHMMFPTFDYPASIDMMRRIVLDHLKPEPAPSPAPEGRTGEQTARTR